MQILIADDDPTSLLLLQRTLERLGYDVTAARGGLEAWERFQRLRPPLVITDWLMPDLDGLEFCRRIRADVRFRGYTYLMVLTSLTGKVSYMEGMNAGADDFLTKPFDHDELVARLRVAERIMRLETARELAESLLPCCPDCHKIQDESGRWWSLERYVAARKAGAAARPLCPDCLRDRGRRATETARPA